MQEETAMAMRWKFKINDDGDEWWVARASPAVGGRYGVYTKWRGNFHVAYEDPEHDYDWRDLEGTWATCTEAKAAAEADHAQRRAIKDRYAA
jgi:hypothetical protein